MSPLRPRIVTNCEPSLTPTCLGLALIPLVPHRQSHGLGSTGRESGCGRPISHRRSRCAGAVKRSHIPRVKITPVDHGSCFGDEAVEGGLAVATAPGHNSVNGRERGGVTS
ncbi:LOW QUALITY PROTEIN: hypothetical protein YC2023_051166 [Brassica napus]